VIALTIQRLLVIVKPFAVKYRKNRIAWKIIVWIALTSLVLNVFTLFVFQLNKNDNNQEYCDINKKLKYEYFVFNSIYMLFVLLVPSIIITVCNSFIIHRTFQNKLKRKKLFENNLRRRSIDVVMLNNNNNNKDSQETAIKMSRTNRTNSRANFDLPSVDFEHLVERIENEDENLNSININVSQFNDSLSLFYSTSTENRNANFTTTTAAAAAAAAASFLPVPTR
jgi:hypothetical protein